MSVLTKHEIEAIERRADVLLRLDSYGNTINHVLSVDIPRLLGYIKSLQGQLSELCPIADLDAITSLRIEKQFMAEEIARLEAEIKRLKPTEIECWVCSGTGESSYGPELWQTHSCGRCEGTGYEKGA